MRRRYLSERLPGMEVSTIRSCDVKRIVRDHLLDFALRQRYRVLTRQAKREARKQKACGTKEPRPPKGNEMKSPIMFRAEFSGPKKGPLNPAGFRLPGNIAVELYHSKIGPSAEWCARRPGTNLDFPITSQSQVGTLKNQMEIYFERQVSEWETFDTSAPRGMQRLRPEDWAIDNQGKPYLTPQYINDRAVKVPGVAALAAVTEITKGKNR